VNVSTLVKRWSIAPKAPLEHLRQYRGLSPVLAQVLYQRGFDTPEAARRFLDGRDAIGSWVHLKGIHQAVGRLRAAIKKGEQIVVYGDFDADGVTATTLLVQALITLNANVRPYIPHRVDEGYGLNSQALRKLASEGAKVVVTVDCGIRSVQEVEDGKAAGLDMIVTDHHSIGPDIPRALAVINPKQVDCKYPEEMLAGVGIAYKLAEGLFQATSQDRKAHQSTIALDDLLDLVAIGTVADIAPLNSVENRLLVRRGLAKINQARRPGIFALLEVAGIQPGSVDAGRIGFGIGPRINAAGRLGSAMTAYDLLSATDSGEAARLAAHLQRMNSERQEITRATQELISRRLEALGDLDAPFIFAADAEFKSGIVGLVAGRLAEEFNRPAIVMETGEIESRASCRSIPQFDITRALDECADLLVRHGGHSQAAGLTILNENIPAFKERLSAIVERGLQGQDLSPLLEVDVEVEPRDLTEELVYELALLEPCGHLNESPVLMSSGLRIVERRTVGNGEAHLKLRLSKSGQPPIEAIGFRMGSMVADLPARVDVAYQLEMNEWNGRRSLQLNLKDVRPTAVSAGS
jgi:single-stranded-DNA-specific exonuclease